MIGTWEAASWGAIGGLLVDGLQFLRVLKRHSYKLPPAFKNPGYWVGAAIRLSMGAILAVAVSREEVGPLMALTIGISGPAVIEKLSRSDIPYV